MITITAIMKFTKPIISIAWKRDAKKTASHPSQIEEGYQAINNGLSQLVQAFALI
ncbi:MAG: hypothetical protein HQL68_02300 [Magnetococcales bacterium]|nr:hypothetical protein [Magnetococcales bacterium]